MNKSDVAVLMRSVASVVRELVDDVTRTLAGRIDGIEAQIKALPAPKDGAPGPKGDPGERGEKGLDGAAGERGIDGPAGQQGDKGDPGDRGEKGEPGEKGIDGAAGERGDDGARGEQGPAGYVGEKGEKGDAGDAGAQGPQGEPGAIGPRGEPGPQGEKGIDGAPGRDGERGIDGKSVTIDDVRPLFDAAFAGWALDFERRAMDVQQRALERMPAAKDGRDGRDAFDLDDLMVELGEDGRTLTFKYVRGETVVERSVVLSVLLDAGVYRPDRDYAKGDGVTFGGQLWVAQRSTQDKPGTSDAWRLAVNKGRDASRNDERRPAQMEPVRVR